jgi:beta-lactamase class A
MSTVLRHVALVSSFVFLSGMSLNGQSVDDPFENRLREAAGKVRGTVGIYVRHLRTGETVAINADSLFPTASMIKVPILCSVFDKIEKGELDYHTEMVYRDSLLYAGVDILGSFADSSKITLSKLVMLMIATSDNTASLWLQFLAGTGSSINSWMEQNGYMHTRVNSRTPGREAMRAQYGWGVTTPREMANLLVQIREGRAVSPGASEEMYRVLSNIYWSGEALSEIPPTINAASKQGAVDRSRSEVVLVNAPHGDYVFCVITKSQDDTSWVYDNEGYVLIRTISRLLWEHFEPDFGWKPLPEHEKWAK